MTIRVAIVGLGKIAHDQHIPAIAKSGSFKLVAAASRAGSHPGIPVFRTIDDLLASDVAVDAIAMCQPPQVRYEATAKAIAAGKHVLLEKPPGSTLSEVEALVQLAAGRGITLFATWHSRYAPGVEPARAWLADKHIHSVEIVWKEDVRRWHPGQQWIWQPGGLGVFDPGINALSIMTRILPRHVFLLDGVLEVPANRDAPIAADLRMIDVEGAPVHAAFDWRQTGPQSWNITVESSGGRVELTQGGARATIAGIQQPLPPEAEYPSLYEHFAELIREGRSDVDRSPLRLVADAFLRCRQERVEPFID